MNNDIYTRQKMVKAAAESGRSEFRLATTPDYIEFARWIENPIKEYKLIGIWHKTKKSGFRRHWNAKTADAAGAMAWTAYHYGFTVDDVISLLSAWMRHHGWDPANYQKKLRSIAVDTLDAAQDSLAVRRENKNYRKSLKRREGNHMKKGRPRNNEQNDKVLALARQHYVTIKMLADTLGLTLDAANSLVWRMLQYGQLRRVAHGLYALPSEAPEAAPAAPEMPVETPAPAAPAPAPAPEPRKMSMIEKIAMRNRRPIRDSVPENIDEIEEDPYHLKMALPDELPQLEFTMPYDDNPKWK